VTAPPPGRHQNPDATPTDVWWDGTRWRYGARPSETQPTPDPGPRRGRKPVRIPGASVGVRHRPVAGDGQTVLTRSDSVRVLLVGLIALVPCAMAPWLGLGANVARGILGLAVGISMGLWFTWVGCLGLYASVRGIPHPAPRSAAALQRVVRRNVFL
jgi:hypothetical protein